MRKYLLALPLLLLPSPTHAKGNLEKKINSCLEQCSLRTEYQVGDFRRAARCVRNTKAKSCLLKAVGGEYFYNILNTDKVSLAAHAATYVLRVAEKVLADIEMTPPYSSASCKQFKEEARKDLIGATGELRYVIRKVERKVPPIQKKSTYQRAKKGLQRRLVEKRWQIQYTKCPKKRVFYIYRK